MPKLGKKSAYKTAFTKNAASFLKCRFLRYLGTSDGL